MLRSYFLTAFRNLLRNKLNALVNIIGLAVAFTCSILLFLMVHYEFSFDTFQKNGDRIFQLYHLAHEEKGDTRASPFAYPAAGSYKAEVAGIVKTTAIMSAGREVSYNDREIQQNIR